MTLRIATWNINSIRPRLAGLRRLIAEASPDVICLQETKVQDEDFPRAPLAELGYRHDLVHGMKSYNGVAILSRVPFAEAGTRNWCGREDCRHAFVRLRGGIELHNVYVPAGGDVPDPERNDKFAHKLSFLEDIAGWFAARRRAGNRFILAGDLNVAPLETDVWSHKQLLKVVSHTPAEVERLGRLQASLDWGENSEVGTPSVLPFLVFFSLAWGTLVRYRLGYAPSYRATPSRLVRRFERPCRRPREGPALLDMTGHTPTYTSLRIT